MNAKKVTFLHKFFAVAFTALAVIAPVSAVSASADDTQPQTEKVYFDSDPIFHGYGEMVDADYYIYCDEVRLESYAVHPSAPTYGNGNSSLTNACGAISGNNVVVFYDRYYPNLLVDFEPGMISGTTYSYFPDLSWSQTVSSLESLYSLMHIPTVGGTTSANFRSGLASFMANQGYTTSYTSFQNTATMVDLNGLIAGINANKVGVIMCSTYNYITSMNFNNERVYVVKQNCSTGHIMMVYGYETIGYYNDGVKFAEKTFLLVSSGYSTGTQGYMELNDFSTIDEAWIVNVS